METCWRWTLGEEKCCGDEHDYGSAVTPELAVTVQHRWVIPNNYTTAMLGQFNPTQWRAATPAETLLLTAVEEASKLT